eukprot:8832221-Alexandrium_andersonii.AAC.1
MWLGGRRGRLCSCGPPGMARAGPPQPTRGGMVLQPRGHRRLPGGGGGHQNGEECAAPQGEARGAQVD